MTRQPKHAEYLVEGRVVLDHVDRDRVEARVRGDGAGHSTGWTRQAGWRCTCPARTRCAHLRAVGLVVAVEEPRSPHVPGPRPRPTPIRAGATVRATPAGQIRVGGPVSTGPLPPAGPAPRD